MLPERSHRERRRALMAQHGEGVILVRGAAGGDVNPDFFYLTGLAEPRAALLLAAEGMRIGLGRSNPGPDYQRGRTVHELLFLPAADPLAASWGEDSAATVESVDAAAAGVDAVLDAGRLDSELGRALESAGILHYVRGAFPTLAGEDDEDVRFIRRVRDRYFGVRLCDATPSVHELRRLKDGGELVAIERSIALTGQVIDHLLATVKAGMQEHEVEGEITRIYRAAGAGHAFSPIVACGLNAVLPHYKANSDPVEAGRLLLVDTGAALGGYRSDITRTFPVDGRFDARQREIYDIVLSAQREAIEHCRPGSTIGDIHASAYEVIDDAGFGESFIHGTSHHLGLETHDVGDIHAPLAPGAVITVEPGIYLPDEKIGVRIEDDVLVTEGDPRILSEAIPVEADEIERRMA